MTVTDFPFSEEAIEALVGQQGGVPAAFLCSLVMGVYGGGR